MAVAEVLDWDILRAVCDADAVARLERRGLIQLVPDGSHLVARLNHPVIGEAAIRHAGVVRIRQVNGLLAQQLSQRTRCSSLLDDRDEIRLAQFMTRSDLPADLDVIVRAAESAVAMSNLVAGEELARFAVDRGGGCRRRSCSLRPLVGGGAAMRPRLAGGLRPRRRRRIADRAMGLSARGESFLGLRTSG